MSLNLKISDEEIGFAEEVLLRSGENFDAERRAFISDFETLDLNAVPGSGKTTALLAKLLILERHLSELNNPGVLIISHTNNAINEIQRKIKKYCPKLYSYPNFIGTIQNFVDQYLAIPFYRMRFKKNVYRVDDEACYDRTVGLYNSSGNFNLKGWINRKHKNNPLGFLLSLRLNKDGDLVSSVNSSSDEFELQNKTTPTYLGLINLMKTVLEEGYLHYDDAYILGFAYLDKYPRIKSILQKRFSYVFVDEMQDMEKHQHDILEALFYDGGKSTSIYQRIGDKNQAIFSGEMALDEIWQTRENVLSLNGSYRLSSLNAELVQCFSLEKLRIDGRAQNNNGTDILIKPHIIIYNDLTITKVIEQYARLIAHYVTEGLMPDIDKSKYFAIAWRKNSGSPDNIDLSKYFNGFSEYNTKTMSEFQCLAEYIECGNSNKSIGLIAERIIRGVLKFLRVERVFDKENKAYTKTKLLNYLEECGAEVKEEFLRKLYEWSLLIARDSKKEAYDRLCEYLPILLYLFEHRIITNLSFIQNKAPQAIVVSPTEKLATDFFLDEANGIKINISSVHSVKGQTHTATLYMETFFSKGRGNYESERLYEQFKFIDVVDTLQNLTKNADVVKKSAKMMYVGLSRPTHLICIAVKKDRFDRLLSDIDRSKFEIIDMTL